MNKATSPITTKTTAHKNTPPIVTVIKTMAEALQCSSLLKMAEL